MKKIIIPLLITLLLIISCRSGKSITGSERIIWDSQTPLEEVVAQMTLSEKIGQMTQAERSDIYISDISKYALGSILSGGGSVPSNNTQNGWTKMIGDFTEESLNTRAGIPVIYGIDAVHGHNNVLNAVITPHNIALGAIAAGDMEKGVQAAYNAAQITAQEMKATGIFWTFAPVLGIAEDVRWGRTYECYSEDVNIVTALGTSTVKGLQEGGVAACIKHYIGEGQTVNGRNQGNAVLDRNNIERLLIPYRAAIDAGAMSLMASFSSVNNIKMHEHKELLTDILKGELGFQGMILSDWAAIEQLSGRTYKAQIANAINAGIDMVMATNGREKWTGFIRNLHQLVEEGTVPMSRIDDAVIRILRFKQSAGILNMRSLRNLHGSSETHNALTEQTDTIGSNKNRQTARSIVSDSLVLLRNENNVVANLSSYKNILVTGQGADNIGMQCGGWTITWQGNLGPITKGTTILEGIREAVNGRANVSYNAQGKARGNFDAVIAVIGENPYAETQGDRSNDINIRHADADMLKDAYSYGCPVIVIMLSGRPMTIGDEYKNWDAFIAAWLPGTEGGGIADVLFGNRNFTGRTPYTWRKTINGDVLYPLGFGLTGK